MVKRIASVAIICLLLVTVFAVPSMAFINSYYVQGDDTASFYIPPYDLFALDTTYLPIDFYAYASVNTPLLLFNHFDVVGISADGADVSYTADEAYDAGEGVTFGLAILDTASDMLPDGTNVQTLNFCICQYEYIDDTWVFDDLLFEPVGVDEPNQIINTLFFATDVISDPTNVSDFFAYMYPTLPITWTEYAKVTVGSYTNGYFDGEIEGRNKANIILRQEGYDAGMIEGFEAGKQAGLAEANSPNIFRKLIDAVIFAPVNGIVNMFNFDFFGTNLSYLVLTIITLVITFGLILWIMRFWA